jgi:hypothetical protein
MVMSFLPDCHGVVVMLDDHTRLTKRYSETGQLNESVGDEERARSQRERASATLCQDPGLCGHR